MADSQREKQTQVLFFFFLETKGRHANVKAHEAVDHLASFSIKQRGDFTAKNRTANLFFEIWVSLHPHPVV